MFTPIGTGMYNPYMGVGTGYDMYGTGLYGGYGYPVDINPHAMGSLGGGASSVATYSTHAKDDTAIKVASFGALAVGAVALLTRGKFKAKNAAKLEKDGKGIFDGLKNIFKRTKKVKPEEINKVEDAATSAAEQIKPQIVEESIAPVKSEVVEDVVAKIQPDAETIAETVQPTTENVAKAKRPRIKSKGYEKEEIPQEALAREAYEVPLTNYQVGINSQNQKEVDGTAKKVIKKLMNGEHGRRTTPSSKQHAYETAKVNAEIRARKIADDKAAQRTREAAIEESQRVNDFYANFGKTKGKVNEYPEGKLTAIRNQAENAQRQRELQLQQEIDAFKNTKVVTEPSIAQVRQEGSQIARDAKNGNVQVENFAPIESIGQKPTASEQATLADVNRASKHESYVARQIGNNLPQSTVDKLEALRKELSKG